MKSQEETGAMIEKLIDAMADMREQEALSIAQGLLASGEDPLALLASCRDAMSIVGDRFEKGEYFLPELVLAAEVLRQIADLVTQQAGPQSIHSGRQAGKIIFGSVQGDIHDIGKNIVIFMLEANGFEVRDLGIDVPAERFVESIWEFEPEVVGLSGFMTVAFDAMRMTIKAIETAGLRDRVKVMIGGGMVDEHIRAYTGADAYGKDAVAAVSLAQEWCGGK
jgi:methanogenic corrinoid protein MtbC1